MSRAAPLSFPEREAIQNEHAQTPLPAITRGTSLFEALTGGYGGLMAPTEHTALMVSAIYSSVNLIAGAIAALPIYVYRRNPDGEHLRLPSDDLWWLLNEEMTPRWGAASGWEYLVQSLLLPGDGYAKLLRNTRAEVVGVEPLHPNRVTPVPTPDGRRLIYVVEPDPTIPSPARREREVLDQDDVLHVPGFGFDGVRGLSPLRYALRMTGSVSLAAQDYSARFFANGARPDYALQTDQALAPETVDKLRTQIDERHGGYANAHRPMLLTSGLKVQPITMPAEDMQLLETRKFQIEEIARIYGIPPFMIGHNEKTTSWGSGVEAMGIGFVRYTLRQHLNKFQSELNRKLFRTAAKVVQFDTTELERADTKALFEAFRVAIGRAGEPGFMSVEEVRERLSLPRQPKGRLNPGTPDAPQQAPEPAGD